MILLFTAKDKFGNENKYSWWFSTMEFALDTLSTLPARGKLIIKAELIDNSYRIKLPLNAFDGQIVSSPLLELENQWQDLLKMPVKRVNEII